MHRYVILLSFVLVTQAWAMGYGEIGPQQPIDGSVNFDLYQGYLMVARGSAGPVKGLAFLLDTGASPSVLDPRVAKKLHLATTPASILVVGGAVQAEKAIVPSLDLGPVHTQNLPVFIEDLSFLQKALPFPIDGVIGLDVLGQSAFLIDYVSHKIRFGPYPVLPNSISMHLQNGLAIVEADIDGSPANLLLDTGASALILFARGAAADLKKAAMSRTSGTIGTFEHKQVKVQSLRLGAMEFGQEPAAIVPGGPAGYAVDGLMSPAALGITRVAIDLGRGEMAFSR